VARRLAWVIALIVLLTVAPSSVAAIADEDFAPVDRKGPKLSVPAEALAASLTCTANVRKATTTPVLLLAGTAVNSDQYFGWNWKPALTKAGIPWCVSDIPSPASANQNLDDMQVRGEYVTYAIRAMHKMAKRKISIIGHSQGGVISRWSLRFWPDTRDLVDDVIGLGPTSHGTPLGTEMCPSMCHPAIWQQRTDSRFYEAVDSYQQTFEGISYTVIRSDFDPLVPPVAADLTGPGDIANVRIQDRCPANTADHDRIGTGDPVTEALALDALRHPGPARLDRVDAGVCQQAFMSGVNPETYFADFAAMKEVQLQNFLSAPRAEAEPPLACYTREAGCR
jgi:Putative serine esterase (DUF676)